MIPSIGAPIRFLYAVIGSWCLLRVATEVAAAWMMVEATEPAKATIEPARMARTTMAVAPSAVLLETPPSHKERQTAAMPQVPAPTFLAESVLDAAHSRPESHASMVAIEEPSPVPIFTPTPPLRRNKPSRWRASAWLYAREAGDAALASAGQLGGSQIGARLTWQVDGSGRIPIALAARAYAPLRTRRGAEAAVGIEAEPLSTLPVRLSVERRIGLTSEGRNAWSAYAAGGVYRELAPGMIADAYVQAGIVGAQRRDGFVDGALRIGRRLPVGKGGSVILGGGVWGAAQPQVSRIDVGPRVALVLPVAKGAVTIATEYRARMAGNARPGSSFALTIATDF